VTHCNVGHAQLLIFLDRYDVKEGSATVVPVRGGQGLPSPELVERYGKLVNEYLPGDTARGFLVVYVNPDETGGLCFVRIGGILRTKEYARTQNKCRVNSGARGGKHVGNFIALMPLLVSRPGIIGWE